MSTHTPTKNTRHRAEDDDRALIQEWGQRERDINAVLISVRGHIHRIPRGPDHVDDRHLSPLVGYCDYSQRRLAHHEQHSAPRGYASTGLFPGAIHRCAGGHVSKGILPGSDPPSPCPVDAEPALSHIRAAVATPGHPDEHVLDDESRIQHLHGEPRDVRQTKDSRRETQAHPPTTASPRVKGRCDGGFV